nr:unnamed protein product [Digitaria exilis]
MCAVKSSFIHRMSCLRHRQYRWAYGPRPMGQPKARIFSPTRARPSTKVFVPCRAWATSSARRAVQARHDERRPRKARWTAHGTRPTGPYKTLIFYYTQSTSHILRHAACLRPSPTRALPFIASRRRVRSSSSRELPPHALFLLPWPPPAGRRRRAHTTGRILAPSPGGTLCRRRASCRHGTTKTLACRPPCLAGPGRVGLVPRRARAVSGSCRAVPAIRPSILDPVFSFRYSRRTYARQKREAYSSSFSADEIIRLASSLRPRRLPPSLSQIPRLPSAISSAPNFTVSTPSRWPTGWTYGDVLSCITKAKGESAPRPGRRISPLRFPSSSRLNNVECRHRVREDPREQTESDRPPLCFITAGGLLAKSTGCRRGIPYRTATGGFLVRRDSSAAAGIASWLSGGVAEAIIKDTQIHSDKQRQRRTSVAKVNFAVMLAVLRPAHIGRSHHSLAIESFNFAGRTGGLR